MTPEKYNKISGIYKIECIVNHKVYIGQSKNILYRWCMHKSKLRSNTHSNPILQNDFNQYGENNFTFEILQIIPDNLTLKEKFWIDIYGGIDTDRTYNFWYKGKANKEFKNKISRKLKGRPVDESTKERLRTMNIGRPMSEHAKQCLIERNKRMKNHYKELNTGKIFITNGIVDKTIKKEDFFQYEKQGFYKGRVKTRWRKIQSND